MRDDCQYIGLITLAFVLKARARQIAVYGRVRPDLVAVVAISAVVPGGSRIVLIRHAPAFSLVRTLSTVMTRVLAAVFVAGTLEYFAEVPFAAGFAAFALAFLFAERIFPEETAHTWRHHRGTPGFRCHRRQERSHAELDRART